MLDARFYVPFSTTTRSMRPAWSLYYTEPDNPDAVEPPPDVKAQQDLYRELLATADPEQQRS